MLNGNQDKILILEKSAVKIVLQKMNLKTILLIILKQI